MLFNSIVFAFFLPVVFAIYWLLQKRSLRLQNAFLLVASYVFYGWWDWRFLLLLALSSVVGYSVSRALRRTAAPARRRALLAISVSCDLGILGFFKYFNFFVDSFADLMGAIGVQASVPALRVILPVGISFYTFQSLSYMIDVYRRQVEPARDPVAFLAYVSFFPQLVAGPIERAGHLLPQFLSRRVFDAEKACDGLRQMLWGLFKKVVIADNLAGAVERVFANPSAQPGPELVLGAVCFATQIYCDFSGYSDMAVGVARLLGFDLMRNFAYPYFSRDVAEFWRRWHISLSTWFRDYVYIPLGGSRGVSTRHWMFNILLTFTVSGLWHGANWTFVIWGLVNGLFYIPPAMRASQRRREGIVAQGRWLPSPREALEMAGTFGVILVGWVFFRSPSLSHALQYLAGIPAGDWLHVPRTAGRMPFVLVLFVIEWLQREKPHALAIGSLPRWVRWLIYYAVCAAILFLGNLDNVPFIYFQF